MLIVRLKEICNKVLMNYCFLIGEDILKISLSYLFINIELGKINLMVELKFFIKK